MSGVWLYVFWAVTACLVAAALATRESAFLPWRTAVAVPAGVHPWRDEDREDGKARVRHWRSDRIAQFKLPLDHQLVNKLIGEAVEVLPHVDFKKLEKTQQLRS
jgi:hypothetical protein